MILEVNEAAIQHYGYSREEFLRHDSDQPARAGDAARAAGRRRGMPSRKSLIWRHQHKNGNTMDMEVIWSPLTFRGPAGGADDGHRCDGPPPGRPSQRAVQ